MNKIRKFFVRVGRFFWSWGFLKFVLWTATLVVLFYVEEDWRGARAWAATKAKWEKQGETFDLNAYFAPPVPDDKNLGAIPLFRLSPAGDAKHPYLDDNALRSAMDSLWDGNNDPRTLPNGWIRGEAPDLRAVRASIATAYVKKFGHAASSDDSLAQLESLDPVLAEIREASAQRPLCRFEYDNTQALPAARALGLVVSVIKLSRVLTYHGLLALDEHRPDIALADFETAMKLGAAAGHDPSLVGGLVQMGACAISLEIVWQGLALHAWNDAELAELDRQLSSVDFLAVYRFCMSAEGAVATENMEWFKQHPADLKLALEFSEPWFPKNRFLIPVAELYAFLDAHGQVAYGLWPRGWFDLTKALAADSFLREREVIDLQAHRAYPEKQKDLNADLERFRNSPSGLLPWNFLWTDISTFTWTQAIKFGYAASRTDEARIACCLERYRLAHQRYPASLDALAPEYLAEVPRDVMTGLAYHYEARPDGTFLLYSVGWNLTDEGGVAVFADQNHNGIPSPDLEKGDWVWPTPK